MFKRQIVLRTRRKEGKLTNGRVGAGQLERWGAGQERPPHIHQHIFHTYSSEPQSNWSIQKIAQFLPNFRESLHQNTVLFLLTTHWLLIYLCVILCWALLNNCCCVDLRSDCSIALWGNCQWKWCHLELCLDIICEIDFCFERQSRHNTSDHLKQNSSRFKWSHESLIYLLFTAFGLKLAKF